jgi:putative endonuclease
LVYFEATGDVNAATAREKQVKGLLRTRKITLIERDNPQWKDLGDSLFMSS